MEKYPDLQHIKSQIEKDVRLNNITPSYIKSHFMF